MAIQDATKLALYNGALRRLGSRNLASLTENREPRRVLDDIWGDDDNVVDYALARGEWNFAIRTVQAEYSELVTPPFGLRRAFDKPADLMRVASIAPDEYFRTLLTDLQYKDEAGFWFTDYDVIYVRYVSNADTYGYNDLLWTETFKDYIECRLAYEGCERITNSTSKRDRQERDMGIALMTAKSQDTMNEGVKFAPPGAWVMSRSAGHRRERG